MICNILCRSFVSCVIQAALTGGGMNRESAQRRGKRTRRTPVKGVEAANGHVAGGEGAMAGDGLIDSVTDLNEEFFRAVIQNAMDGIAIIRTDGTMAYVSPSISRLVGRAEEEHIDASPFGFVHEDDMQRVSEIFADLIQAPSGIIVNAEMRVWHKDGSIRNFEVVGQNLIDNRIVNGIVANMRDITERKRAEGELEEYRKHLEELVEERTAELKKSNEDLQIEVAERKRVEAELAEYNRELETLFNIGITVSQTLNLAELLNSVLKRIMQVMDVGMGGIYLIDRKTKELVLMAHRGVSTELAEKIERLKADNMTFPGKPVVVEDASGDIKLEGMGKMTKGLQSFAAVPVMAKENILGIVGLGSYNPHSFPKREIQLLVNIANQIGMAVDNAQLYGQALELASTDGLTGLYNRRYLMEQLEREFMRMKRKKVPLSLMMVDLDGLKMINDRYGHNVGDEFLRRLAEMIRSSTRNSDIAARWGGDEFMLIAPETDCMDAASIGERIRSQVEEYVMEIKGDDVRMGISIGVASYPDHALSVAELLQKVDSAMYSAKKSGKNRVCIYSP